MPNMPAASDDSSRDPWIFREVREPRRTIELLEELEKSISARNSTLTALIQCGQLESALADAQSPAAPMFSGLTNEIAAHYCGSGPPPKLPLATSANSLPATVCVSPPEGFTYYAVHPLDYAVAARTLASTRAVAGIGLRSIGTTLSAVVTAALNSV